MKINRCTNLETGEVFETNWSRRKIRRTLVKESGTLPRNLKFETIQVPDDYLKVGRR